MKKFEVKNHEDSFLPDGNWELVWADEFDGKELDTSKWDYRLSMMGRRSPHWVDDAVEVDGNSNVVFKIVKRGDVYCTTQLQTGYNFMDGQGEEFDALSNESRIAEDGTVHYYTWPIGEIKEPKFMHKYGYYECRCKLQKNRGWWSAFWLQSPIIGAALNPEVIGVEVDIMESGFHDYGIIQHDNHWNGYGSQHESTGAQLVNLKDTEDGYHRFGLEWTKDYYRYYVDGVLTWEVKAPHPISQIEQFIILSAEAVGYRSSTWSEWGNTKKAYDSKDEFIVDYVRVFDRKD